MADFDTPKSRNEAILQNILGAENELTPPQSRIEAILQNMLGATYTLEKPQSRIEDLLIQILEQGGGITPTGEIEITENGTYDVTEYASADVNVSGGGDDENFVKFIEQDSTNVLTAMTTEVVLPATITRLAQYACYHVNLKKLTVPASVHQIPTSAFDTARIADGVVFLGEITSIQGNAFKNFACLPTTNITIAGSNTQKMGVGNSAFSGLMGCNKITLGNPSYGIDCGYVQSVCSNSQIKEAEIYVNHVSGQTSSFFQNCTSLTKVKMSMSEHAEDTQGFGSSFFKGCTACLEYDFTGYRVIPTLVNSNAFDSINANAKIVVPDDLYDDWVINTNWTQVRQYIVKESDYIPYA